MSGTTMNSVTAARLYAWFREWPGWNCRHCRAEDLTPLRIVDQLINVCLHDTPHPPSRVGGWLKMNRQPDRFMQGVSTLHPMTTTGGNHNMVTGPHYNRN